MQPAVAGIYCLDFMGRTLYWEGALAEGNPLQMILMGRRVETFRPQDILLSHLKTLLGCMCCTSEVSMAGATFSQQNWQGNSRKHQGVLGLPVVFMQCPVMMMLKFVWQVEWDISAQNGALVPNWFTKTHLISSNFKRYRRYGYITSWYIYHKT